MDGIRLSSEPVRMLRLELEELEEKAKAVEERAVTDARQDPGSPGIGLGIVDIAVSGQRVVDYDVLEHTLMYDLPDEELDVLLRIVEAEAGNEDEEGKLLVANVVLNRMNAEAFPDTISGVVLQREKGVSQFSPVANGSFYRVKVSEETVSAVSRALMGEDISQGALYFAARKYADRGKMRWFDENLTYLFVHGGHEFFK
ncbi:MAG: cell wall hydrolase [Lachnospiraceae bacterium]|nr:cell wall hydrolase [Lachnospiraceae bacterium]